MISLALSIAYSIPYYLESFAFSIPSSKNTISLSGFYWISKSGLFKNSKSTPPLFLIALT